MSNDKNLSGPPDVSCASTRALNIPELSRHIIDFLHNDKDSLRQCSLVCRTWLPATSYHLFKRLLWPPCQHAFGIREPDNGCSCGLVQDRFWSLLIDLLQSSQRIRSSVRTLIVAFQWSFVSRPNWAGRVRIGEFCYRTKPSELAAVVDNIPNLKCLHLRGPMFSPDTTPVDLSTGRSTRIIDELILNSPITIWTTEEELAALQDCLRIFRRISNLQLPYLGEHCADYTLAMATEETMLPEIGSIQFETSTSAALVQVLKILVATAAPSSVTHLRISNLHDAVLSADLVPILQALPYLEELELSGSHATSVLAPDVAHLFPRLRTLVVFGVVDVGGEGTHAPWLVFEKTGACVAPHVEELALCFALVGPYACVPDGDILEALRTCNWSNLTTVVSAYPKSTVTVELMLHADSVALQDGPALVAAIQLVEKAARELMPVYAQERVRLQIDAV